MSFANVRNITAGLATAVNHPNGTASTAMRLVTAGSKEVRDWAAANPGKAAAVGTGAVLVAAPMMVAAPLLGSIGFGANGIIAGSIAAGAQSGVGSVVAPSLFATLQSAGAAGYGVAAVTSVVQGTGAVVASIAGLSSVLQRGEARGDQEADAKEGEDKEQASNTEARSGEENGRGKEENDEKLAAKL